MRKIFGIILLLSAPLSVFSQLPDSVVTYHWEELPEQFDPDTIISLSLSKMKLDSLPAKLSEFKNLQHLDLGKNKLTSLPPYIVEFKSLKTLNLEKNRFEIFPLVICQLVNLESLILNRNTIERVPDCIEFASNLVYIDFYDNPIRHLPESFERLKNLKKVDFSGIRFAPSFQERWIRRMPNTEFVFEVPCDCME